jgi:hypothetical protein
MPARPDLLWARFDHAMTWTARYFDPRLNREGVSRAFASKEEALREACFLMRKNCLVQFVEGPNDEKIDAVEIAAWCKAHRTRDRPVQPT